MFFFACRSCLIWVGCMERSDSRPCLYWSNVKKQTTVASFFKWVAFAVVWKLYPGFVRVPFACTWLTGVQILTKRPFSRGGYKFF